MNLNFLGKIKGTIAPQHLLTQMILLIKPILIKFATSTSVKRLLIDVLKKLVSTTDNTLDDKAVEIIEKQLFPGT